MTWTVFEFNSAELMNNETGDLQVVDDGGYIEEWVENEYKHVLVPAAKDTAIEWWEQRFGENPRRLDGDDRPVWTLKERETQDEAAATLENVEVAGGGIGSPERRPKTLNEARRDDSVLVLQEPEFTEEAHERGIPYERLPEEAREQVPEDAGDPPEQAGVGESVEEPANGEGGPP